MEATPQILRVLKELNTPQKPTDKERNFTKEGDIIDSMLQECLHHCLTLTNKQCCTLNTETLPEYVYTSISDALASNPETVKENNDDVTKKTSDITQYNVKIDLRWTHVVWNLALLKSLNIAISEAMVKYNESISASENKGNKTPSMSPDTLSMSDQKLIIAAVQFVVGLGILPCLQPGVGVPIENRSNFGLMLMGSEKLLCEKEKEWRLLYCLMCLLQLTQQPALGALILSRNLGDILAGLLQISCASTLKKISKASQEHKAQVKVSYTVRELTLPDLDYCERELKTLIEKVYPPMVVRELLVLQGGMPVKTPNKDNKTMLQRSPIWLRKACGKLLTDILMKPKGVQFLLRGMLGGSEGASSIDWKKCEAIGKVIAHCPKQNMSVEEYYENISPQILELIHIKDKQLSRQFIKVVVSTLTLMLTQKPEITQKCIIQPLLQPLLNCVHHDKTYVYGEIVANEQDIEACLEDIYKVFVVGCEPNNVIISTLKQVIHCIFRLYCVIQSGISHQKNKVEDILLLFLKESTTELSTLKLFAFEDDSEYITKMVQQIQFVPGDSGGVKAIFTFSCPNNWEARVQVVVELLKKVNNDQLSADLFIYLLKELSAVLSEEIQLGTPITKPSELFNDESTVNRLGRLQRNLMLLSLLASMCENLGHTCFKSTEHILQFVKVTLDRCVMVLQNTEDEQIGIFESETVTMAMGLLTAVMSGAAEVSARDREKTKELLPFLHTLSEQHPDSSVKEMATDLRIAIATHGFVLSSSLKKNLDSTKSEKDSVGKSDLEEAKKRLEKLNTCDDSEYISKNKTLKGGPLVEILSQCTDGNEAVDSTCSSAEKIKSIKTKKPLIEVLSSTSNEIGDSDIKETPCKVQNTASETNGYEYNGEDKPSLERSDRDYRHNYKPGKMEAQHSSGLKQAFEELLDPLVPVRGHALISLRRLIEKKDMEALEKQDILLKIFKENLDHSDTYIYLSAIQGLATLADRIPEKVIIILAEEYAWFNEDGQGEGKKYRKKSPELRMKVGEVMMKSIKGLGEVVPHYRDTLLNAILLVALDKDHLVRASAVSNLGELCKLLRFSIGGVIYRVLDCVSSLIKTDPEVEVRRAAAMFITLLLQGLGENAVKILDSAMRDLYHLLKFVHRVEADDIVKVHVQLSLEELDEIMKKFLFPEQTFAKKINVLDPPKIGL